MSKARLWAVCTDEGFVTQVRGTRAVKSRTPWKTFDRLDKAMAYADYVKSRVDEPVGVVLLKVTFSLAEVDWIDSERQAEDDPFAALNA